jgi:hypothetical protein
MKNMAFMMKMRGPFLLALLGLASIAAPSQLVSTPEPQPAEISGTVFDTQDELVPGATVMLQGSSQKEQTAIGNDDGLFEIDHVAPGVPFVLTIRAPGFADWTSTAIVLQPGQFQILTNIRLTLKGEATSVTVTASREQIAVEQVKAEEQQRVFGIIPNFYVVYDRNAVPLSAKLKFELALKVSVDPITFAGTAFLAGINQASRYPDYVEGAQGYGQRLGSLYANDFTDIMVGGAILPSLLHQDPRYFYQGTGTKKSRLLHALSSPIICKGDNGRWQPNFSSLGGYLASGALANAYYPPSNRGAGLVGSTFAIDLSANVANGVIQEFVLRKLTPSVKNRN